MENVTLKKARWWIILGGLLLAAACAEGEVQTYRPSSYPVYTSQYYYPDLRPGEQDPEYWRTWQDRQGGGG